MATWKMFKFHDPNSLLCERMILFHDFVMVMILLILSMIIYMVITMIFSKFLNRYLLQGHLIEIIWTLLPMLILALLVVPSLKILYLSDEVGYPSMTVKAVGHQWYWSYEYSDFSIIEFDSFMLSGDDDNSNFRLLDVDNRMCVPYKLGIRLLTTSVDVIHSWTVQAMGVKMDSIPGRINQSLVYPVRPGVYYGQCSEICGANHSFMPIVVECTEVAEFWKWYKIMMVKNK